MKKAIEITIEGAAGTSKHAVAAIIANVLADRSFNGEKSNMTINIVSDELTPEEVQEAILNHRASERLIQSGPGSSEGWKVNIHVKQPAL